MSLHSLTARIGLLMAVVIPSAVLAVQPEVWVHTTEADFAKGEPNQTVVSSHGELTAGRQLEVLVGADDAPTVVSAMALDGETIYFASGTDAAVYRLRAGQSEQVGTLPSTVVTSLRVRDGRLLAGGGGDQAGIYRFDDDGQAQALWTDEDVKYVWDLKAGPGESLYAATGPGAAVYVVQPNGQGRVLYDLPDLAKNILTLAAGEGGILYAGTDQEGLVAEINPVAGTGRVILDADEKEISALVADGRGGLFVATADGAKAQGKVTPRSAKTGKAGSQTQPADQDDGDENGDEDNGDGDDSHQTQEQAADEPTTQPAGQTGAGQATTAPAGGWMDQEPADRLARRTPGPMATSSPSRRRVRVITTPSGRRMVVVRKGAPSSSSKAKPRASAPTRPSSRSRAVVRRSPRSPSSGKGNAVYHVGGDGIVRTLFRKPVAIHSMILAGDRLLLGTGDDGQVFALATNGDQYTALADTEAKQVTALVAEADGTVLAATANQGSLVRMGSQLAREAVYLSDALDAKQLAHWGTLRLRADVPAGTALTVATRTGNVAEPDEKTWSDWSAEVPVDGGFLPVDSPSARLIQYRLTFTGNGQAAPVVHRVELIRQVGNLAPQIKAVLVSTNPKANEPTPEPDGKNDENPKHMRYVKFSAADANKDELTFEIHLRQVGTESWIRIADDLDKPMHQWDTRTTADGRYHLKVVASDKPSNPPAAALTGSRISEPVVVDNTPPALRDLAAVPDGQGGVSITGRAVDKTSRLIAIAYSLNSADEWVTILPADGICDSGDERFSATVNDVAPGPHRLAVKVVDLYGNVGYGTVQLNLAR